jgi:hypothetical protein
MDGMSRIRVRLVLVGALATHGHCIRAVFCFVKKIDMLFKYQL